MYMLEFRICMVSDILEHHFKCIQAVSFEYQTVGGIVHLKLCRWFHFQRPGNILREKTFRETAPELLFSG